MNARHTADPVPADPTFTGGATGGKGRPSVAEVAALTRRLRTVSRPGADPAERAAFLADKAALLARITGEPAQ